MSDVRLIDANVVISYIDDCIAESREEREDAKSRGNDCEVNYNAGEIQMARRIKRKINLGTPTIETVPVVHARWLPRGSDDNDAGMYYCSACKDERYFGDEVITSEEASKYCPFCPNCGAKMDGGSK